MINILFQEIDEETGNLKLTVAPRHLKDGVVKISNLQIEKILDEMGIKRGKWLNPCTISNKPNCAKTYVLIYESAKKKQPAKKSEQTLDKSSKPVTLKKTTTRKKKTGG